MDKNLECCIENKGKTILIKKFGIFDFVIYEVVIKEVTVKGFIKFEYKCPRCEDKVFWIGADKFEILDLVE